MLTKDAILGIKDFRLEEFDVPEWGGKVWLRSWTGKGRDAFEASFMGADKNARKLDNLRARACAMSICDESGERIFSDADAPALGEKSAAVLDRMFQTIQRMNGLGNDAVEEMTKN